MQRADVSYYRVLAGDNFSAGNRRFATRRCGLLGELYNSVSYHPASTLQSKCIYTAIMFRKAQLVFLQTRTTAATLVTVFIHGFAFFGGEYKSNNYILSQSWSHRIPANYYLPVYFQVLGASATRAGIEWVILNTVSFLYVLRYLADFFLILSYPASYHLS